MARRKTALPAGPETGAVSPAATQGQREQGRPVLKLGGTTKRLLGALVPITGRERLLFSEKKVDKKLCAKLRFASGDSALRGGFFSPLLQKQSLSAQTVRYVLSSDGKNQRSPGIAFDKHLACAGVYRRLIPGPLFTRVGTFNPVIISSGQNLSKFCFSFRPTGACCYLNS